MPLAMFNPCNPCCGGTIANCDPIHLDVSWGTNSYDLDLEIGYLGKRVGWTCPDGFISTYSKQFGDVISNNGTESAEAYVATAYANGQWTGVTFVEFDIAWWTFRSLSHTDYTTNVIIKYGPSNTIIYNQPYTTYGEHAICVKRPTFYVKVDPTCSPVVYFNQRPTISYAPNNYPGAPEYTIPNTLFVTLTSDATGLIPIPGLTITVNYDATKFYWSGFATVGGYTIGVYLESLNFLNITNTNYAPSPINSVFRINIFCWQGVALSMPISRNCCAWGEELISEDSAFVSRPPLAVSSVTTLSDVNKLFSVPSCVNAIQGTGSISIDINE